MAYLYSNVPYFKAWVRREYTHNHQKYHGEFLHAMVIGVTTLPNRCLSFQGMFTGSAAEGGGGRGRSSWRCLCGQNAHNGISWRYTLEGMA